MSKCRTEGIMVHVSAEHSHNGQERWAIKTVDACIADIVKALNYASLYTDSSCCGHGEEPGSILLRDGRELRVHFPDGYEHKKQLSGAELVDTFVNLFDDDEWPTDDDDIDEFLRDCGHDPDEVAKKMAQVAEEAYQSEVTKLEKDLTNGENRV